MKDDLMTDKDMQRIYDENQLLKEQLKKMQALYDQFMLPELHEHVSMTLCNSEDPLRPVCVQSRWGDLFGLLYHYLKWHAKEWEDDENYFIDLESTAIAMGQEIARAAGLADPKKYLLARKKIHVLQDYYLEEGLMRVDAKTPFTPRAEMIARRYAVYSDQHGYFKVM